jgi:predicted transcriptional regulator
MINGKRLFFKDKTFIFLNFWCVKISIEEAFSKCNQTLNTIIEATANLKFKDLTDTQIDMCTKDVNVKTSTSFYFKKFPLNMFFQLKFFFKEYRPRNMAQNSSRFAL